MSAILYDMALSSGAKVSPEQSVEVDEYHGVHEEYGEQEVAAMLQQREVDDDVIGYVKLGTQAEGDICEEVEELVSMV